MAAPFRVHHPSAGRNDMGVEAGSVVPIDYDPMLGKLVVHAEDRPRAIARLGRALDDYEIAGVETTLPLFRALVGNREFADAAFDVQWLDRRLACTLRRSPRPPRRAGPLRRPGKR